MAEPIHATPAEARRWQKNLDAHAPPPTPVPLVVALRALLAASKRERGQARSPADLSWWQGHEAGVAAALAVVLEAADG